MQQAKLTITNETGLHARPANQFVQAAMRFQSEISVKKDNIAVNAKGILGILTLGAGKGTEIVIQAIGVDEEEAITALTDLIEAGIKD